MPERFLSDERVREMRERASQGESDEALAEAFQVALGTVKVYRRGEARKAAGGPLTLRKQGLPDTAREELRKLYRDGIPIGEIAETFGITKVSVMKYTRGLPRRRVRPNAETKKMVRFLIAKRHSPREIASQVGVSVTAVRNWTRDLRPEKPHKRREREDKVMAETDALIASYAAKEESSCE